MALSIMPWELPNEHSRAEHHTAHHHDHENQDLPCSLFCGFHYHFLMFTVPTFNPFLAEQNIYTYTEFKDQTFSPYNQIWQNQYLASIFKPPQEKVEC
jgi:hypothetical protein